MMRMFVEVDMDHFNFLRSLSEAWHLPFWPGPPALGVRI